MTIITSTTTPHHQPNPSKDVRIVVLPGDNIGPEVTHEALRVLQAVFGLRAKSYDYNITFVHGLVGGAAIDAHGGFQLSIVYLNSNARPVIGSALPQETLDLIDHADTKAILFGAIGGPKWPPLAGQPRPEQGENPSSL